MLRYTPCTRHTSWAAISRRLQWRGILHRRHASTSADDAQWFPQLRDQMLQRGAIHLPDHLTTPPEYRLAQTLMGFLPLECCSLPASHKPILPVGHHLIWFNPAVPTDHLLPDGTDASHSPGGPWVRRMWAGGSLKLNSDDYFNKRNGFARDTPMTGVERIKHVQLRGQGDAAKIFVTIERRFARLDTLKQRYSALYDRLGKDSGLPKIQAFFENQLLSDDDWGDALLKEERNLVFLKERSTEELGAIKAGQVTPIKYLDPPGKPIYSYTMIPDRNLLFRFSALTFNAHLIHLDPDFARNVEGHRNLLVHGPLSLILMLQAFNRHLKTHTQGEQVVESMEYRNLAPLYCDEEMRICGLERKTLENGSIYDVWIEGPTGGAAVKGTIYTTVRKRTLPDPATLPRLEEKNPRAFNRKKNKALGTGIQSTGMHQATEPETTSRLGEASVSEPSAKHEDETSTNSEFGKTTSQSYPREVDTTSPLASGQRNRRDRPSTRLRSYQFITPANTTPPIHHVESYQPGKPVLSSQSKYLLRRLVREDPPDIIKEPLPLVRTYAASPYVSDPDETASRHSRFLREGVREIEEPSIRYTGNSLALARRKETSESGDQDDSPQFTISYFIVKEKE
ncbi:hypothetical protein ACJBU6_01580 [Exserohilum turcicum]